MNKWYLARDPESYPIEHWEEIKKARPVVIEGWEELDLCVHKVAGPTKRGRWGVTEGRSGVALCTGSTVTNAVALSRLFLEDAGKARIEAKIVELVERFGISPRYAEERSEG